MEADTLSKPLHLFQASREFFSHLQVRRNDPFRAPLAQIDSSMAADAAAPSAGSGHVGGVDTELLRPLELAVGTGDLVSTKVLLAAGATVAFGDNAADDRPLNRTVLHWAAFGGSPDVVTAVLQGIAASAATTSAAAFAATEAATQTAPAAAAAPLVAAIAAADAAVARTVPLAVHAKSLSEAGGPTGTTPLHLAVEGNHLAAAAVLVAAGDGVEDVDGYGRSLVNIAVEEDNEEMLLLLLQQGADIKCSLNDSGETPLHRATFNDGSAMCEVLIREGAILDARDGVGATALHFAVHQENTDAVNALLQGGAAVDAVDERQATPLNYAVSCPNQEIVDALLVAGADVSLRNVDHHSAMYLAMRSFPGGQIIRKMLSAAAAAVDDDSSSSSSSCKAAAVLSGLATIFAMQLTVLDESHAVAVLSVLLDMGIDLNKFRLRPDSIWKPPVDSTLLHIASLCARPAVVERLLCGGAHHDVVAQSGDGVDVQGGCSSMYAELSTRIVVRLISQRVCKETFSVSDNIVFLETLQVSSVVWVG